MSVLLFLILHAMKALSSPYDCYWLCVYIGLDGLWWLSVLRIWLHYRR